VSERFCVNLSAHLREGVEHEAKLAHRTVARQIDFVLERWLAQRAIARSKGQNFETFAQKLGDLNRDT
jgi:hypothetical protein